MPTVPVSPSAAEHYFGFGKQSAKGTGVAPAFFAAFVEELQARPGKNIREIQEGGTGPYIARGVTDLYVPTWRFAAALRPDVAAAIYAFFLGTAGVPAGTGAPYTHTLTNASGRPVWTSFERNIGDEIIERIVDGFITEIVLDIRKRDQGPEAMLEVSGTGLSLAVVSAATDSYEADRPFLRSDAAWKVDNAAVTNIERARVVSRWVHDEGMTTDAVTRADATKVQFQTDVEVVTLWSTAAEALAYKEIHYPVVAGDGSGTAPSERVHQPSATNSFEVDFNYTDREFKLNLAKVLWKDAEISEPNPSATEACRLTRRGVLIAATTPVTVTAKNTRSTNYLA